MVQSIPISRIQFAVLCQVYQTLNNAHLTIGHLVYYLTQSPDILQQYPALLDDLVQQITNTLLPWAAQDPGHLLRITQWAKKNLDVEVCHERMKDHYSEEILALASPASGFHFGANTASPNQIHGFSFSKMSSVFTTKAPRLWDLMEHMMMLKLKTKGRKKKKARNTNQPSSSQQRERATLHTLSSQNIRDILPDPESEPLDSSSVTGLSKGSVPSDALDIPSDAPTERGEDDSEQAKKKNERMKQKEIQDHGVRAVVSN